MVEVSKHLFEQACGDASCHHLLHPWEPNCFNCLQTYRHAIVGSAKFYLIVHLLQNLLRGKKIFRKKELLKAGENYVRSAVLGAVITAFMCNMGCLFRWLQGNKFKYYTFFFVPGVINGVFIMLEPPSRRGIIINLFCNQVIEYWMRSLERAGYISITRSKLTSGFMMGCAFLFYLMRLEGDKKKRTPLFWFYTPVGVRQKTEVTQNVCPHDGLCSKYIIKGTLAYFGLGLAFKLVPMFLSKAKTPMKAFMNIRWNHLNMAMFFGSYVGVYRAMICYLCNKSGVDSTMYAIPAGFIAGLSFYFKPNLGLAIASVTAAFKIYSTVLYEKKILSDEVPLPILLFCLCHGILLHSRMMHPDVCPSYMIKITSAISNGCIDWTHQNMLEAIRIASIGS